MIIYPAIDIIEGKCVRLTKGRFEDSKTYGDPLDMAMMFEDHGLEYLHMVDLDAAKSGSIVNWRTLEKIASSTDLHIDFGGGLKTDHDLRIVFECGAEQANVGSLAVKKPDTFKLWLSKYGADKMILSADVRDGKVASAGWQEQSDIELEGFIAQFEEAGLNYVTCTDIDRDGMLEGPSTEIYDQLIEKFEEINIIASGGVSGIKDIMELERMGCYGVIIGKAIYEGKISLADLSPS